VWGARSFGLKFALTVVPFGMSLSQNSPAQNEIERVLVVQNKMGIHARPAAMMVRVSNKYNGAEVWVEKDQESVNGKSIMGLMMLAAGNGSKLRFRVSGESAEQLLAEMEALFARKFEET
jgi:phosphocarrier protein HPr